MKKLLSLILAVSCTVMLMTACQSEPTSEQESSSQSQPKDYAYQLDPESVRVYDVAVPSRGIEIPGTLTLPAGTDTDRVPLVIFEHDLFGIAVPMVSLRILPWVLRIRELPALP